MADMMRSRRFPKKSSFSLDYNSKSKGGISLLLLIVCMFAALVAQLALLYTGQELRYTRENLYDRQLRALCYSAMDTLEGARLQGKGTLATVMLEPINKQARLTYEGSSSGDGSLYSLRLRAEIENNLIRIIRRLDFYAPEELRRLACRYPLVYRTGIEGTEYLSEQDIYTSNEEVIVPRLDVLENIGLDITSDEIVRKKGFNSRFYCIRNNSFTFFGDCDYYGSTVFTCKGDIKIGNNSSFPGAMVFIAEKGNIRIGENTHMDKAIIIAKNNVLISPGCRIKGIIYADSIRISGKSQFIADENLVARFSSKSFIS